MMFASLMLFIVSCGSSTQVRVSNKGNKHRSNGVNYDIRYNSNQNHQLHHNHKKHVSKHPKRKAPRHQNHHR